MSVEGTSVGSGELRGLYDSFEYRRTLTTEDYRNALDEGLVSIDTNILLNLYRYEDSSRSEFMAILGNFEDRLFFANHVIEEFWRRREDVLGERGQESRNAIEALEKAGKSAEQAINTWMKRLGVVDDERRSELIDRVGTAISCVSEEIELACSGPAHDSDTNTDDLLGQIEDLVAGRVAPASSAETRKADLAEARRRLAERIPPGFLDQGKEELAAAGDYLIWRETLRAASERSLEWLVFVSDDVKPDWRRDDSGSNPRPRVELEREALDDAGVRLVMLTSNALLHHAKDLLGLTVSDGTLSAASSIVDVGGHSKWSDAALERFFELLEARRPELARVIEEAAEGRGFIDRNGVYRICGYDSDRTLKRFTMPATGIAKELIEEGILAEDVMDPIWAVYDGPGRAIGFEIPEDLIGYLLEEND